MASITALHFCIFRGSNEQAIALIEGGESDLNAGDNGGQTPCHIACYRDNVEVVKKLIEAGADPAKADKSGNTPLHAAAGEGAMACVNLFVEKGVPSGVKNVDGFTPLDLAELHCPPASRAAMLAVLSQHAAAQAQVEESRAIQKEKEACLRKEIEQAKLQQQLQQQQEEPQQQQQLQQQPQPRFLHPPLPPSPSSIAGDAPARLIPAVVDGGRGTRLSRRSSGQGRNASGTAAAANGSTTTSRGVHSNEGGVGAGGERAEDGPRAALAAASGSKDPSHKALYRMLLHQHRSIAALSEVVKKQADTIAGLVGLVGAGAGRVGVAAAAVPGQQEGRGQPAASSGGGGGGNGESGGVDYESAIAEMVAFVDDSVAPSATPGAVVGP